MDQYSAQYTNTHTQSERMKECSNQDVLTRKNTENHKLAMLTVKKCRWNFVTIDLTIAVNDINLLTTTAILTKSLVRC